jgi:hypothetical protein
MSLIVNYNGDTVKSPDQFKSQNAYNALFTAVTNITTYFPLPATFNANLPTIRYYKVPVQYSNRADLIAKEVYGSEEYWWVLYWANNLIDPFTSLNTDDVLKIIDITSLESLIH